MAVVCNGVPNGDTIADQFKGSSDKKKRVYPSELFYKILQNFIKFCKFLHDFMKYFLQTSHFYKIIYYFVKLCMFL